MSNAVSISVTVMVADVPAIAGAPKSQSFTWAASTSTGKQETADEISLVIRGPLEEWLSARGMILQDNADG